MATCKLCRSLIKVDDAPRLAVDFEPWELIESEKLSGCQACGMILAGLREFQNPSWQLERDVTRVYLYGSSTSCDTLSAEIYYKDDRPKLILEFFHIHHDSDAHGPWEAIRARKQTNGHPLEQDALSWVKFNLDICEHGHESCSPNINQPLPFRTLLLKKSAEHMVEVMLVESEPGVATGQYATLSHRWGNHQTCITTLSNVQNRMCGIPWHTIPKTFQDAMIYCLKLGIDYIWIDALCIIQDSPKDWQQQSAQMAGIYQNSYITLSATTTTNDSAGCFSMSQSTPARSNKRLLDQNPPIYIREKLRHWMDPGGGSLKERFPLLTRAWVFQERILSTRTLHFCDRELVWECAKITICECDGVTVNAGIKQQFATSARYAQDKMSMKQARDRDNEETASDAGCNNIHKKYERLKDSVSKELAESEEVESQARHDHNWNKNEHPCDEAEELARAELKNSLSLRVRSNVRPNALLYGFPIDEEWQVGDSSVYGAVWGRTKLSTIIRQALRRHHSQDESSNSTNKIHIRGRARLQANGRDLGLWHKMVEQYSNLEITRSSDRLPALSGLAERIAPESRPYLAGLWKDTLRLDLLWRVDRISEAHGRVPGNLSPTWSWSSVSSGVKYWTREDLKENIFYTKLDVQEQLPLGGIGTYNIRSDREWEWLDFESRNLDNRHLEALGQANRGELDQLSPESLDWCLLERSYASISNVSYEMVQSGENPFGEVEKGVLKIEGYVRQARLKYVEVSVAERYHDWENDPLQYQLDFATAQLGQWASRASLYQGQLHFYADYDLSQSHPEHQVLDNAVVYLLESPRSFRPILWDKPDDGREHANSENYLKIHEKVLFKLKSLSPYFIDGSSWNV